MNIYSHLNSIRIPICNALHCIFSISAIFSKFCNGVQNISFLLHSTQGGFSSNSLISIFICIEIQNHMMCNSFSEVSKSDSFSESSRGGWVGRRSPSSCRLSSSSEQLPKRAEAAGLSRLCCH